MKNPVLLLLALCLFVLPARADDASQRKAAEVFLVTLDMEKMLTQSIDQMLALQVQSNPQLAPHQEKIRAFLTKHMGWAALKNDVINLYTAEFTEAELNEMNKFYQTPTGRKMVEKMPVLMTKGAQLGQSRVQANLPELESAITGGAKKEEAPKKAP